MRYLKRVDRKIRVRPYVSYLDLTYGLSGTGSIRHRHAGLRAVS